MSQKQGFDQEQIQKRKDFQKIFIKNLFFCHFPENLVIQKRLFPDTLYHEAVRDAKEATWQDYASSLDCRRRPAEVWATVHEMDGNVPTTQRLPALRHQGKVLPTDAKKAAAFADMYAEVCRGRRGQGPEERRAERRRERALAHRLRAGACDPAAGICAPLTAAELDATL